MKYAKRILALTLIMLPLAAFAQLSSEQKIVANVPFEFTVGNKVVPAGEWTTQRLTINSRTLLIRNPQAGITVPAFTLPGENKTEARTCALVFNRYGNQYFLSEIKVQGDRGTYRIPQSRAEAELLSENRAAATEVLVASLK